jgi:hypothetical protein
MIAEAAKRLVAGEEGAEVVEYLRRELRMSAERGGRTYSVNSLKTYVSHTKSRVVDADCRNPHCDFGPLLAFAEPEVTEFLVAPLKRQLELQRRHRAHPSWSDEAEEALASLRLLPANMDSFHITEREVRQIKRWDKGNMRERMANVVVVDDGEALLARAVEMLRCAKPSDSYVTLLAPLLLVSGRREIEVLNVCSGRAAFEKVGERAVRFTGQCKTKCSEGVAPFIIPLLCEADVFVAALSALREKRGDLSGVNNAQIHVLMNGHFTPAYLTQAFPMLPVGCKWHLLRSLYLQFVNHCFTHTMAVNFLGKQILGHFDEAESLRYVSTRVDGIESLKGTFGRLVASP